MEKSVLRNHILDQRLALQESYIRQVSENFIPRIESLNYSFENKVVALYSDFKNEVPTHDLFYYLKPKVKTIVYPRNYSDPKCAIRFYEVEDLPLLKKSRFGILEPSLECLEVSPEDIDVYFVPGVAYDQRGFRVGYGSGCYDVYFSKVKRYVDIFGLAYDFQIVPLVRNEEHDIQVKKLITDKRIIHCHTEG
ncbi:MAG: 5-formyltetrahydrofolate cyclo-ligase [Deltaproteobacteria bacterium]|nr:5-formyltetrahydrofolate cyclo-ligase [Deltaproteobacteria bacterium]